jgi:hypothetical protein
LKILGWGEHPIANFRREHYLEFMKETNRLGWRLGLLSITAVVVVLFSGCASGPFSSNLGHSPASPDYTWRGDNHTPPVYTSPDVTPATKTLPNPSD